MKRSADHVDESETTVSSKKQAVERDESSEDEPSPPAVESEPVESKVEIAPPVAVNTEENESKEVPDEVYAKLAVRALITSREAAAIIGKQGSMIKQLSEMCQCQIKVSENHAGSVERILTLIGPPAAISKAAGLATRVIVKEPLDLQSSATSPALGWRFLCPSPLMGSIIGKGGSNIRLIAEQSSAKVVASPSPLPMSSDRVIMVNGVADAVHIALYHIANTMAENYEKVKFSATVPYTPLPVYGHYGNPSLLNNERIRNSQMMQPNNPYGVPPNYFQPGQPGFRPPDSGAASHYAFSQPGAPQGKTKKANKNQK